MFKNIVIGMSGGVDSAVAAFLLKSKGFNVQAVFMQNWDIKDETGECIADKDFADADLVCKKLKIPLIRIDFVKEYWNDVFSYLVESYQNGVTPNPDIQCNKKIKFNKFYFFARNELKADAIATGHYVRTNFGPYLENYSENTNVKLLKGKDVIKDQAFFLSQVPQESLKKCMFPVGEYNKTDIKRIAKEAQLYSVLHKKESMGICFIGSRNFQKFIKEYIENKSGHFIDFTNGKTMGFHNGFHYWTVGQGCKIGGQTDRFMVFHKNIETNDIWIVPGTNHSTLYSDSFIATKPYWISKEPDKLKESKSVLKCEFRFQHRRPLITCSVFKTKNEKLIVLLSKPLRAITQGQFAVFYMGEECLGSAKILYCGPSYYSLGKTDTCLED
ncbi:mitochondrial tRNA-specific 2-thiouridylase 1 isoform X1 [Leptopilina heterotoma]|uniref:mitochondrial tRNA-specific 2-thiouridylase 1 isoform X1 n=1 Tax=Leptopilina heterotoma TaxID=63436 RepID=UPI001CAA3D53|nr:mitochondrial tRNA-specific 2-thiouridylase 1 isoform X1 [Leptopilina heterotoma]